MNVLVVGCGRLGRRLAAQLQEHGDDVAVIDANPDTFRMLDEEFNGMTVTGFPMDMKALRSAGIENCDAVAVCTPDDNLNITISEAASEFFKVKTVVARISDPGREKVFKSFGLKSVCHTKLACDAMFGALVDGLDTWQVHFATATAGFHAMEVPPELVGCSTAEIPVEKGKLLFGISRADGSLRLCSGEPFPLTSEDHIIIANVVD